MSALFTVAEVNHGRWVVRCPWCPSARRLRARQDVFACTDCHGQEVRVSWPNVDFQKHVEELLAFRPLKNRNWQAGESLDDLAEENVRHGLPVRRFVYDREGVT